MNTNKTFNFLLVTRKDSDSERIKTEIERNKLYKIETVETSETCMERLKTGGLHCLLFNFGTFSHERLQIVNNIRDVGFAYPTVVFAQHATREVLEQAQKIPRMVTIEKPFESKDVWGICQKLLQGQKVNQRIFRRFHTNQAANIEKTATGETLDAQIFNLSRGGAYVELGSGRVSPGDLVRVTIPLDKVARNYNVDAEVIWCSPRGYVKSWPAAGVRFVQPGEVYRNLLNKL